MKVGIFVGSFNPFTVGHDSIVTRALPLYLPSAQDRIKAIADLYADEPRIEVKPYYGLAVDFAKAENARFIVKGVRSVKDFEYEREQADINRQLSGVETILLYSEPQYSSISSTMVRELQHFGVDVSPYLPKKSK